MRKLMIYLGFDPRERAAYDVARASILRHCPKIPGELSVQVVPLKLANLQEEKLLTRPHERRDDGRLWCPISKAPMSTEFAFSRFCVPFLRTNGLAVYMDCDVIVKDDIRKLFDLADPKYAVQVVKHDLPEKSFPVQGGFKMDGQRQTIYPRKNWSSVVLWNLEHPAHTGLRDKERDILNRLPGVDLHGFCWLKDEEIGALPREWNVLVGVQAIPADPKVLHFTLGGPWLPGWTGSPHDKLWLEEKNRA